MSGRTTARYNAYDRGLEAETPAEAEHAVAELLALPVTKKIMREPLLEDG